MERDGASRSRPHGGAEGRGAVCPPCPPRVFQPRRRQGPRNFPVSSWSKYPPPEAWPSGHSAGAVTRSVRSDPAPSRGGCAGATAPAAAVPAYRCRTAGHRHGMRRRSTAGRRQAGGAGSQRKALRVPVIGDHRSAKQGRCSAIVVSSSGRGGRPGSWFSPGSRAKRLMMVVGGGSSSLSFAGQASAAAFQPFFASSTKVRPVVTWLSAAPGAKAGQAAHSFVRRRSASVFHGVTVGTAILGAVATGPCASRDGRPGARLRFSGPGTA